MGLIGERPEGVGYLLKERVGDVTAFVDAVTRVASGGSALDPEVVGRMLSRRARGDPLQPLTGRGPVAPWASPRSCSSAMPPWRST